MIVGIGTDIVEISRIEKSVNKNDRFLERLFSAGEIKMFKEKESGISTIAANFAGKEAVLKVFGTGMRGLDWSEISIMRDDYGKPIVILEGRALEVSKKCGIDSVMITLSHSKDYAIAYALGIKE
jgi:holo-[acyl-carrier protein] synthase